MDSTTTGPAGERSHGGRSWGTGRWLSAGLGGWLILCAATVLPGAINPPPEQDSQPTGLTLALLVVAAGVAAIANARRPTRWTAAALVILGALIWASTVITYGSRGLVGAVLVGATLGALVVLAAVAPRLPFAQPWHSPPTSLPEGARILTTLAGCFLFVLFGIPLVNSWLRGVAPYDLWDLTPATLPGRFSELGPVLSFALGVTALVAGLTRAALPATIVSAAISALLISIIPSLEPLSGVGLALRYIDLGGIPIAITLLIAATGRWVPAPQAASP